MPDRTINPAKLGSYGVGVKLSFWSKNAVKSLVSNHLVYSNIIFLVLWDSRVQNVHDSMVALNPGLGGVKNAEIATN